MTTKKILIDATDRDELRLAVIHNNYLFDMDTERPERGQQKGNIYKAKITSIEKSLAAVFVKYDVGKDSKHGFLPFKALPQAALGKDGDQPIDYKDIDSHVKPGNELLIQVEKEVRGNKGASVTGMISLAGAYLVLSPNNTNIGGISRKIEGTERDELKEKLSQLKIPASMGVIIRTAGLGKTLEQLQWDLDILLNHWETIQTAAAPIKAPALIQEEGNIVIRAIRDHLNQDINEIIINKKDSYDLACKYINLIKPELSDKVTFYNKETPLFTQYKIEKQIESAYAREVRLKSGGSLSIDQTEALVAVDINSSRANKGGSIEETALNTNLEAADEIARQLKLRDIGGLIVIDFIDMTPPKHQRDVENRLRAALQYDRARIQTGRISRFGLLEMSRQRIRPSLGDTTQSICPACSGQGTIRSVESLSLTIVRLIQESMSNKKTNLIRVQAPIDVATYLLNEKRQMLLHLEQKHACSIIIVADPQFKIPQYEINAMHSADIEKNEVKLSYQHKKLAKTDASQKNQKQSKSNNRIQQPVVKSVIESQATRKPATTNLIKKLWSNMLNGGTVTPEPTTQTQTPDEPTQKHSKNYRSKNYNNNRRTKQRQNNNARNRNNPSNITEKNNKTEHTENNHHTTKEIIHDRNQSTKQETSPNRNQPAKQETTHNRNQPDKQETSHKKTEHKDKKHSQNTRQDYKKTTADNTKKQSSEKNQAPIIVRPSQPTTDSQQNKQTPGKSVNDNTDKKQTD